MKSKEANGNGDGQNKHVNDQLVIMKKMMEEQAALMKIQEEALEKERQERMKKEQELELERKSKSNGSLVTNGQNNNTEPPETLNNESEPNHSELEGLRKQLFQREKELKEKEEQLKERDDRLSLLTQRSESNSIVSEEVAYYGTNGLNLRTQNGELPRVLSSICECTEKGFKRCILYKRDICACSYSCSFVKEYFKPPKGQSFFLA